jgi:hypothetical protein
VFGFKTTICQTDCNASGHMWSDLSFFLSCHSCVTLRTFYVLRFSFYVLRFTFYVLRFTFYVLRFTFYVLRCTFYVLRFTFYVLRFTFYVLRLVLFPGCKGHTSECRQVLVQSHRSHSKSLVCRLFAR